MIKDTTRRRKQIVEESFGNISASCDGCMAGLAEMYPGAPVVHAWSLMHYVREDLDENQREAAMAVGKLHVNVAVCRSTITYPKHNLFSFSLVTSSIKMRNNLHPTSDQRTGCGKSERRQLLCRTVCAANQCSHFAESRQGKAGAMARRNRTSIDKPCSRDL